LGLCEESALCKGAPGLAQLVQQAIELAHFVRCHVTEARLQRGQERLLDLAHLLAPLVAEVRAHDAPVGAAALATDQASLLEAIQEPGDVRHAIEEIPGDLLARDAAALVMHREHIQDVVLLWRDPEATEELALLRPE